jgi:hypothetical protein
MRFTAISLVLCALAVVVATHAGSALESRAAPCRGLTARTAKACPLTVQVHVAQKDMKVAAASETPAVASCVRGSTLVGGGVYQDSLSGAQPINGLRIHGSMPGAANGRPGVAGGAPTSWAALGGFGGQAENGDFVRAFALCLSGGPPGISDTTLVTRTVKGPEAAATDENVTVSCPSTMRLIGGGASTSPASEPSLKPIGSYPSTASGQPLAAGARDPQSWTATGAAGGMQFGTGHPTTTVYAICAHELQTHVAVARTDLVDHPAGPGNLNPGSDPFSIVTAGCKPGTVLLGGGVLADGDKAGPDHGVPQQGVHVRGSYPSDPRGKSVGDGATRVSAWTVIVQSGGQPTPGTDTHAFALCAS